MNQIIMAAASTLLVLTGGAESKEPSCEAGYQTFLGDFTKLVHTISADSATEALRKSLAVYDSCKAGDAHKPDASWHAIIESLEKKSSR